MPCLRISTLTLKGQGYQAMGGQIIDAAIVAVPIQRNRRDDNEQIKRGETPEAWAEEPAKRRQKDREARWTMTWAGLWFAVSGLYGRGLG